MSERKAPVPWSPDTTREIEYEERVDLLGPDGTWIRLRLDEDGIVALSLKGDWTVRQFGMRPNSDQTFLYLRKSPARRSRR